MKKELLQLDDSTDCLISVSLNPSFKIDSKVVTEGECNGKEIDYTSKPFMIELIVNDYNNEGMRIGKKVEYLSVNHVKAIYQKLIEIENRNNERHVYTPELPF